MTNWKEYKLGDLVTFQRGHDLPRNDMKDGIYPVAGSNSIIGFHNEFTTKSPGITIGRSGNIGNPQLHKTNFWAHNTVLYVKEFKKVDPVFFYYLLKTLDFSQLNSGSAVPSLNRNFIHPFKVTVPEDLPTQTAIAEILSSLDDKIELNNKINQELENLAQTLFKQWFIDFEFPVSLNHDSLDLHDEQDLKINTKEKNQINYKNQGNQANPKNQGSDTYRSSGGEMVESELGEIPKGWELVRLGDKYTVSDFVANGSFTSLKENVTILETPSFAIFLRNTDSKSNFTNQLRYVDEKTYNFLSKSRIIGNEICISNVADVGTVFRPPLYLKKPLTLGNNLVFFRSDHPNYFLKWSSLDGQFTLQGY